MISWGVRTLKRERETQAGREKEGKAEEYPLNGSLTFTFLLPLVLNVHSLIYC